MMIPGLPLMSASFGPVDEFFSNVVLLIHGDSDTNDASDQGQTVSLVGDTDLSSSQSKFGTNSIQLDGAGDYIDVLSADDFDFGTGDYTIEAWVYRNGANAANARIWCAAASNNLTMYLASGTTPNCFHNSTNLVSSTVLTDGAWVHVAQVREGGTVALYQNGTRETTGADAAAVDATGMRFGALGGSATQFTTAFYNEIRITKGVARYSGTSYTVPDAPFPNR